MERRLAAILAADVVGYAAHMGEDEERTLGDFDAVRKMAHGHIARRGGSVFTDTGDGFLAEFPSPVGAVRAGFEIQRELKHRNESQDRPLEMRIGVHLADVIVAPDNIYGDGVNIAVRIESAGEPGSVTLSQTVFDHVKRTANLLFEDLGEHTLKNISEPVRLYRALGELENHPYIRAANGPRREAKLPKRPSIAILPFANMSGDAEQAYFADGFSEDIITELARFRALFVVSRNASFAYRGDNVDVRQMRRDLGVAYVLEGSLRKLGERVRITTQLIRTDTAEHVWADRFDRRIDDVFAVQDELVGHIVATIADRVEATATAAARRKRTSDMDAYECLLRGLEYHRYGGVTREHAEQAVRWFEAAIERDPLFGRAHAWRACAVANLGTNFDGNADWFMQAQASAKRALELDENECEVHRILGAIYLMNRDFEKSLHHHARALELNPNHAYILACTAWLHNFVGESPKALELLERARRLDPYLPDYCREEASVAHYVMADYDRALDSIARLERLTRRAAAYAAAAAVHSERTGALEAARDELLVIDPGFRAGPFADSEPYRDALDCARLAADLRAAGLPD